jgi:site-specific recombinase XerD
MINLLRLRNFSLRTEDSYVRSVAGLARYWNQSPDRLTLDQVQGYLLHRIDQGLAWSSINVDQVQGYLLHRIDQGLAWSSINVDCCGLRFFYRDVLGRTDVHLWIPPRKTPSTLPEIFSSAETERLVLSPENIKHRVLLFCDLVESTALSAKLDPEDLRDVVRVALKKPNQEDE